MYQKLTGFSGLKCQTVSQVLNVGQKKGFVNVHRLFMRMSKPMRVSQGKDLVLGVTPGWNVT
jgi:hypothetical protein